jgi:hypothetical protein
MKRGVALVGLTATLLAARAAPAQAVDRQACVDAYEGAQVATKRHQLARARQHIGVCLTASCPGVLRSECAEWLKDLDARQPTVVLQCTGPDGKPATNAAVSLDGAPLPHALDGAAIEVDPGTHELVFSLVGEPLIALRAVVREGEKMQRLAVSFPLRPQGVAARPPPPPIARRPVPWSVYALAGLGVAATGAFAGLGVWGNAGKDDLDTCKPDCSTDATAEVRGRYIAADVALGVAVVSLGAATILYLTRGTTTASAAGELPVRF